MRLPPETQTIYADLLDRLTALDAQHTIGRAPGSFVLKSVKDQSYWYFQHSAPGGVQRQVYVGRCRPSTRGNPPLRSGSAARGCGWIF